MLKYIIRRALYSLLVITGVLLLTFILFRMAAGDPARTVLGKNPSPKEIEDLRQTLASDKPLFWGHWRKTEIFTSAEFANSSLPGGVEFKGDKRDMNGYLNMGRGVLSFKRNFEDDNIAIRIDITFKGSIVYSADSSLTAPLHFSSNQWKTVYIELDKQHAIPEFIRISSADPLSEAEIKEVTFSRYQANPWDSQLSAAFMEIISFKKTFPFISFFNFGRTLITKEPVKNVLIRGIPPSLSLMIPVFLGELILGIIFALLSTAYRNRWPDRVIMFSSIAGMSISYVVMLVMGQWFLGYYFNLFPVWGYAPLSEGFVSIRFLLLPVIIGVVSGLGGGVRFYRTIFINELKQEYLRTAEAKGCSNIKIYLHHLLSNAAVPLITRISTILPFLFTGSLLLESFFGIPGLGYAGINALRNSDLQMIKALVILTAMLFVIMNLITDIAYAWADPRVRVE